MLWRCPAWFFASARDEAADATENPTMLSDPIEFELFKNSLFSVADEMALTIFRTTYSGVLKDNMDYSTAMFDGSGKLAAQGLTLPGHLGSPCGSRSGRARHRSPMRYCRPPAATSARYCAALPAIGPHNFFGDADKIAKNPSPLGDRRCRSWREQSLSSRRDLVRSQKLVAATCWRVGLLGAGLHGRFRSRLFAGESRIRTIGPGKQ